MKIKDWVERLSFSPNLGDREMSRGMLIAVVVGIVAGFGAVIFRNLILLFHDISFGEGESWLSAMGDYYVVLVPVAGGLIVGPLIYFFAREAKGHGVPEVMIAVAKEGGRIRPRVALVKILASALTIGTGGSVGREGPIVQIGSTFGSVIGQQLRLPREWMKTIVACGAAGGISATFNAPIAGVFFALEVILGTFSTRYFSVVVVSSVVAAVVSHAFFPDIANLSVPQYGLESAWEIPLYALLGVLAALVGVVFIVVLYFSEDTFDRLKLPDWLKAALGGIGMGFIGLYSADLFGVGYGALEKAASGGILLGGALLLLLLKLLATSITIGSGGSGGVFAPSLFLGAMLGAAFGGGVNQIFPDIAGPVGAYVIVGMAAVFASSARAPITAVVILFELTRDYSVVIPLMLGVVISTVVAQTLYKESIYTKKMRRKGVEPPSEHSMDLLESVIVREFMTKNFQSVSKKARKEALSETFRKSGRRGLMVFGDNEELYGLVTVEDLERALQEGKEDFDAGEICTKTLITAFPDQSMREAMMQLGAENVGRIPVVSRENERKLVGVLRRSDIIRAYIKTSKNQHS